MSGILLLFGFFFLLVEERVTLLNSNFAGLYRVPPTSGGSAADTGDLPPRKVRSACLASSPGAGQGAAVP